MTDEIAADTDLVFGGDGHRVSETINLFCISTLHNLRGTFCGSHYLVLILPAGSIHNVMWRCL